MFDGDGGETIELQAYAVAKGATMYKGSHPCPQCGLVMDPVQYMYSKGVCPTCENSRRERRVKGMMS